MLCIVDIANPQRSTSRVVSPRLSAAQFRAAKRLFARRNLSPSAYTRRVFEALADGDAAAAREMLDDLLAAVGLPKDAPREDVMAKLEQLYDQIDEDAVPADGGDPLAEAPDPEPVESFAARGKVATLSAKELAACKAKGIDPVEFAARKAAAARRTKAPAARKSPAPAVTLTAREIAHCKRRGISLDDFKARKLAAVKRR